MEWYRGGRKAEQWGLQELIHTGTDVVAGDTAADALRNGSNSSFVIRVAGLCWPPGADLGWTGTGNI